MTLELLEKIFQNLEMSLTLKEAKEKGILFQEQAGKEGIDLGDDYWIQIAKEWDLNIIGGEGTTGTQACLYKVKRDKQGNFVTDTLDQFVSI